MLSCCFVLLVCKKRCNFNARIYPVSGRGNFNSVVFYTYVFNNVYLFVVYLLFMYVQV